MMNELLQQLNEIWRLREKRHVSRAKTRWVTQVKELKRQLQQRVPYAEVVQKVTHSTMYCLSPQTTRAPSIDFFLIFPSHFF
jgi:hypothetical protein